MNSSQLQILNRTFSKQVILGLIRRGSHKLYSTSASRFISREQLQYYNNLDIIKFLYSIIEKHYRNEYFFKNTIHNKILLGRHSLNTTVELNEVPIGKSIADLVLINGKAIVYEIKSEIDNNDRLDDQLGNYYKAFDIVYVVTHEKNENNVYKNVDNKNVGIIILNKRNQLSVRREAISDKSQLINESILKILRKNEYEQIIKSYFGQLPNTTDIMYYRECLKLVNKIETNQFYSMALNKLHERNIELKETYKDKVPYELKFPLYFANLNKQDYQSLDFFLSSKYGG